MTKEELQRLEKEHASTFVDWEKGDTLVTYFRRKGLNSMADAFEEDYRNAK